MNDDIFRGLGIEIALKPTDGIEGPERFSDAFHIVRETLTRIGIASKKTKTLYQSVHILHKRNQYALMHFKSLFKLDGKPADISVEDIARRNTIAQLLEDWKLLTILDKEKVRELLPLSQLRIISFQDKKNWTLCQKYSIGTVH